MKVELLSITPNAEKLIEKAGRACYDSETKGDPSSFIKRLIKSGHHSVLEHASATFSISGISRACSHQIVRHRLASYSQRSQRYVLENGFDFVIPPSVYGKDPREYDQARDTFRYAMENAKNAYQALIGLGIPKEDARFVLPNACCTEIVMTANFREWRHIISLRTKKNAQWEIQELFEKIRLILSAYAPSVFGDLEVS